MNEPVPAPGVPCPRCESPMEPATVKTAIWRGDRLFVVEDIAAQVCGSCLEQFYDESVTEALRRLTEDGFVSAEPVRELHVPVYSLAGVVAPRPRAMSEDEIYAEY